MIKDIFFHGLIEENPFEHIQHFNDICDLYKTKDVTDDTFKLRAFPFTLQGDAKVWIRNLPPDSIRTFQDLTNEFINHFFPPSKVERLRMKINGFTQRGDKTLYDAWVRFKKMLRVCPSHDLTKKEYINTFYREPQIPTTPTQTPNPIAPTSQNVENESSVNGDSQEARVERSEPLKVKGKKNEEAPLRKYKEPIPYPQALRNEKVETQRKDFMQMMKKVHVNMPLIQVLKGMPNYGKFIKNLLSSKGKYEEVSATFLVEECSAIINKQKMPPKLGDLGRFVIPCNMGGSEVYDALVDLGASVNLMPYSIIKKLNLGELKPTRMVLKMGNHTFDTPIGIAKDLMVKVGKLTFSSDFVILEMLEDEYFPIILGRPFLNTADETIRPNP
ncbi:uncharacterized protein [Rutidosis leptorrhynchoides]|uniref:uncharacterized protein n=1 Tax=Rutidosis leptorrhynchoides TaxID=125765 RepID=UPI003A99BF38